VARLGRLGVDARRRLDVSGHTIQKLGGPNSTGKTIIAWNLGLTRVK
jgi:hypothetical protein